MDERATPEERRRALEERAGSVTAAYRRPRAGRSRGNVVEIGDTVTVREEGSSKTGSWLPCAMLAFCFFFLLQEPAS